MRRIRRILHPTDFSRASRGAFTKALTLAKEEGAELLIVHVLSPWSPFLGGRHAPPRTWRELEASSRRWAQGELAKRAAVAKEARVRVRTLLLEGVADEQIAAAARKERADLIVMGTHGRTGLPRLVLGSVAGRVIARAPCPVLTLRGK